MSAASFRAQLGRPLVVLHEVLFVLGVLSLAFISASADLEDRALQEERLFGTFYLDLLLIGPAAYAGFVIGLARMQALVCGFSWMLPRYRRRLDLSALGFALFVTLGLPWVYALVQAPLGRLPASAVTFFWFAVGFALTSVPRLRGRQVSWFAVLIVGLLTSEFVRELGASHTLWISGFLFTVGGLLLYHVLKRDLHREALVAPSHALDAIYVAPSKRAFGDPRPLRRGGSQHVAERRRFRTTQERVQASLYEKAGRHRFGLVGLAFSASLVVMIWMLAILGLPIFERASSEVFWHHAHHMLVSPVAEALLIVPSEPEIKRPPTAWVLAMFMGLWFGAFTLTNRTGFLPGRLYPFSRAERARVVWRASLQVGVAVLGVVGLEIGIVATLAVIVGGNSVEGLPSYLRPILLCAIGMPLLVRYTLARVTPDAQRKPRAFLVVDSLFVGGTFTLYVWIVEFLWRRAATQFSELYLTGAALGILVFAWWYHAGALSRWYARADLD